MPVERPYGPTYEGDFALAYDLFCLPDRSAEVRAVSDFLGPPPARVLDLMCGTGELSVCLARLGYEVTGVDRSEAMLAMARRRLVGEATEVSSRLLLLGTDLTNADLPADQDVAFALNGSWNLLPGSAARERAISSVRSALRRGGRLFLDLFPPIAESARSEPRTFAPLRQTPSGWLVSKSSTVDRDAAAQVVRIHETLSVNGRESTQTLVLHLVGPDEVVRELHEGGFTNIVVHWQPDPRGGEAMVVTATA